MRSLRASDTQLRVSVGRRTRSIPLSHLSSGPRLGRRRRAVGQVAASLCPYQTLGVSESADTNEIKKAYRKLALKYHPDHAGGSESMFLAVHEAYEILMGRKLGKDMSRSSGWDIHDWYWKFLKKRKAKREKQTAEHAEPNRGTASRSQWQSQLAGLRHRAAVRAQRQRVEAENPHTDGSPSTSTEFESGSGAEENGYLGEDEGHWAEPRHVDYHEEDYGESGTADSSVREGRQAYQRLCEEARRRQSLSGTETRQAVKTQLAGLKRRANIWKEMDSGGPQA